MIHLVFIGREAHRLEFLVEFFYCFERGQNLPTGIFVLRLCALFLKFSKQVLHFFHIYASLLCWGQLLLDGIVAGEHALEELGFNDVLGRGLVEVRKQGLRHVDGREIFRTI